ncbi:MAG: hypothetical protein J6S96_01720 [Muribaculaceae bacterium]|nr:hypothetical protein [Muribaculaceae bacterium]
MKKYLVHTLWLKEFKFAIVALFLIGAGLAGCTGKTDQATNVATSDSVATVEVSTYFSAIESYLVDEIGKNYAEGEHCVPYYGVMAVDETNANDILVWGDFWVFNYNQVGDTLKMVSGGNHPGLMHVRQTENGFEVTSFDRVTDGSDNVPSAKRIFGDKYEAFQAFQSDDNKREQLRGEKLAEYVKKHNLSVTMYQDYGWPAKKLE